MSNCPRPPRRFSRPRAAVDRKNRPQKNVAGFGGGGAIADAPPAAAALIVDRPPPIRSSLQPWTSTLADREGGGR